MTEMISARIDMFKANSVKYAEALGDFRAALEKAGFSKEESMQIILKVAEQPGRRPFFPGGRFANWHKR